MVGHSICKKHKHGVRTLAEQKPPKLHRGLKGVFFERSSVSSIDGRAGDLHYRGYSIHDLAEHSNFEETTYLLIYGELPNQSQLEEFSGKLKNERNLPQPILDMIGAMQHAHPMEVLRTSVSALGSFDESADDKSSEAIVEKGIRLTSQVPMIVAAHERIRNGKSLVEPSDSLNHAAHFLYLLTGTEPSDEAAKLFDRDLVLHAEHGTNASAFSARVVTGTDANLYASITAAIAALSGPAHGGAAENVMKMAQEIGKPENAAEYVKQKRKNKEPIMGFGHRVYRAEDPRARHMKEGVQKLSQEMGQPHWYEILQALVDVMKPWARHGVNVNVDFYSGVVYHLHNIPEDIFVPIFAIGRTPGWVVQILEQLQSNILIRPLTIYNGPDPRPYKPMNKRD